VTTVLTLVVVAGAAMAIAWALHPRWARRTATVGPDEGSHWHRFVSHLPHFNGNGNGSANGAGASNGNGTELKTLEEVLDESPTVSPGSRDDIIDDGQFIEGFDLRSVARFSIRFFGCVLAAIIASTFALWVLASLLGLVGDFERFMRGIGFSGFHFLSIQVILGLVLIGIAFCIVMTVFTCIAAALYNVLSYRYEGVRVYLSDAPTPANAARHPEPSATTWKAADDTAVSSSDELDAPAPPQRAPARTRARRAMARGGPRIRT
jgi:transmembrane protein DUF3566